ncbi:MAG: carboxypeptidase-like regulatory domain-containing protein, partial [Bacteroidales bacterium]|nr:carboxypeptidase-like regulatory domain-containing protein [Bacteroidales bacterium]
MKTLLSVIAIILLTSLAPATQVRITGTVTDVSGTPLSGVSVTVKGAANTVKTVANGSWSITAGPEAKILIFSFPGMKTV